MRAIIIDPFELSIKEIDMFIDKDNSSLKAMYRTIDCDVVDVIEFSNFDMWFDDEGLFKTDNVPFIIHNDNRNATFRIVGKAVLLSRGGEDMDETVALSDDVTVDDITKIVSFE